MGPIALFDKSFIHSLTVDEAVVFDFLFRPVVCPITYFEILGDLKKEYGDKVPADVVRNLADKSPQAGGAVNVHHTRLVLADLLDEPIGWPLRPYVAGGVPTESQEGKKGVKFEESPERKAFSRWQNGEFEKLDELTAALWRQYAVSMDPSTIIAAREALPKIRDLSDAANLSIKLAESQGASMESLFDVLGILQVPRNSIPDVLERWQDIGRVQLGVFGRYAAHILAVQYFYYIATANQLISIKPNTWIDAQYLYYLPFCEIFISSDKFHKNATRHFLQEHQKFVWGADLKVGLGAVADYLRQLPPEISARGMFNLLSEPPRGVAPQIEELWDVFRPKWRQRGTKVDRSHLSAAERERADAKLIASLEASAEPVLDVARADAIRRTPVEELDVLVVERRIQRKRGSFFQVPRDMKEKT